MNSQTHSFLLAASAAALLFGCRTADPLVSNSGTRFAEEAIAPSVADGTFPGAISIFYDNGRQEVACVGYADVTAKRRITLDDVYMQCSQTKGFCGVTVAKLVEEGKISLDDPVSKYLPEFRELWVKTSDANGVRTLAKAKNALTVRMCLNHTGGFPFELANYQAMGGWSRRMPLRSVAATAAAAPLLFEPGTDVQYSNVGIDIGAAIVEVVSGQRWEDYLKANVLDPLGMTSSGFWPTDSQLATKLELHDVTDDGKPAKWVRERPSMQRPYGDDRVFPSAGAGLWTTARDQFKFYKMLMNLGAGDNGVRILREETVKSILATSTRPKGKTASGKNFGGYSLGLNAPVEDSEDAGFGHGGAWCTSCYVNWHKKHLTLWAVQWGRTKKMAEGIKAASNKFFSQKIDASGVNAYTGRMK